MDSKAIGQITPHAFSENTITVTFSSSLLLSSLELSDTAIYEP